MGVLAVTVSAADAIRRIPRPDRAGAAWAVRVPDGALAFTGMLLGWDADGNISGDARTQATRAIANLETALQEVGGDLTRVVRLYVYVVDDGLAAAVDEVIAGAFAAFPPAVSYMRSPLPASGAQVGIDAVASVPSRERAAAAAPSRLPAPAAGARVAVMPPGRKVFFSGQIEPTGRKFSNAGSGFRATLENLGRGLEFFGLSKADVVQVKAFVYPYSEREIVEREIAAFFGDAHVPAVSVAQGRAQPSAEIEFTAAGGRVHGQPAPIAYTALPGEPGSPKYSAACVVAEGVPLIFISGLHAANAATRRDEAREIFSQLAGVLFETGGSFRYLVKSIGHYMDTEGQRALRDIRGVYYDPARPPPSSVFSTAGVGRVGGTLTIDMIAVPAPE